ncbi:MAG: FecR domain-containing protein [Prolixibacteraceae bacterium]
MEIQNIPWEAISAKLNHVAEPDDLKQIQAWLDLSAENTAILSEIVNTWTITKSSPEFYQPDMTFNWNKLMQKINNRSEKKIRQTVFMKIATAAALLILVFLTGVFSGDRIRIQTPAITYSKIIAPKGNKTQIILPDSSKVWLNSGSELWYPSDYTAQNREVWMKGECFFQVQKDPDHPLLVHGTKIQVKVFGTCFNVREDASKDLSDVTLLKGKVEVLNLINQKISDLNPGQQLVYQKGVSQILAPENMEAMTSWVQNVLIFNNQPFEEVIRYLDGWYGVDIQLDRSLYYRHNYTFKVKTESLREVLELISIITPINYKIEGDQIKIKYKPKMK